MTGFELRTSGVGSDRRLSHNHCPLSGQNGLLFTQASGHTVSPPAHRPLDSSRLIFFVETDFVNFWWILMSSNEKLLALRTLAAAACCQDGLKSVILSKFFGP